MLTRSQSPVTAPRASSRFRCRYRPDLATAAHPRAGTCAAAAAQGHHLRTASGSAHRNIRRRHVKVGPADNSEQGSGPLSEPEVGRRRSFDTIIPAVPEHTHYVGPGEYQVNVAYNQTDFDDMRPWALRCIRQRLPQMLTSCGGSRPCGPVRPRDRRCHSAPSGETHRAGRDGILDGLGWI
jgi:hypothetical protein